MFELYVPKQNSTKILRNTRVVSKNIIFIPGISLLSLYLTITVQDKNLN